MPFLNAFLAINLSKQGYIKWLMISIWMGIVLNDERIEHCFSLVTLQLCCYHHVWVWTYVIWYMLSQILLEWNKNDAWYHKQSYWRFKETVTFFKSEWGFQLIFIPFVIVKWNSKRILLWTLPKTILFQMFKPPLTYSGSCYRTTFFSCIWSFDQTLFRNLLWEKCFK